MNSFHRDILNVKSNTPAIGEYNTIHNTQKTYYKLLCNPIPKKPQQKKKRNLINSKSTDVTQIGFSSIN